MCHPARRTPRFHHGYSKKQKISWDQTLQHSKHLFPATGGEKAGKETLLYLVLCNKLLHLTEYQKAV